MEKSRLRKAGCGLPCGYMVKNPPASAGDKSDPWSDKQQSSEACVPKLELVL